MRHDRSIVHVDMNCFYAAVEILDDPSLVGRPVVVGGTGKRGVVAAASYEARIHGIHSAMPTAQARRLCHDAVFLSGRFSRYEEVSRSLHRILESVTPFVEPIALDEAFLDVSGSLGGCRSPVRIASSLGDAIVESLGISASLGVGTSKMIAKLASRDAKPTVVTGLAGQPREVRPGAGIVAVEPGQEIGFLHPKPVSALWGVGPSTRAQLARLGVETVGDLARLQIASLTRTLGAASARYLHALARADDPRPVVPGRAPKSLGHEETFARDIRELDDLNRELVRLSDGVFQRLAGASLAARTVTLKIKYASFATVTRSATLAGGVCTTAEISRIARRLASEVPIGEGIRLAGVSVSHLVPRSSGAHQLRLGIADDMSAPSQDGTYRGMGGDPWDRAEGNSSDERKVWEAVNAVRGRFGDRAVGPASLLPSSRDSLGSAGPGGIRPKRRGDTQWGPSA